jgi:hypothetical protein
MPADRDHPHTGFKVAKCDLIKATTETASTGLPSRFGASQPVHEMQRFDLSGQVLLAAKLEITICDFQSANFLAMS